MAFLRYESFDASLNGSFERNFYRTNHIGKVCLLQIEQESQEQFNRFRRGSTNQYESSYDPLIYIDKKIRNHKCHRHMIFLREQHEYEFGPVLPMRTIYHKFDMEQTFHFWYENCCDWILI